MNIWKTGRKEEVNNVCVNICRSKIALSSIIQEHNLFNLTNTHHLKLENIIIQQLDDLINKYGQDKITLVIYTGHLDTLEKEILPKVPHAFVIWNKVDEKEILRIHKEYIKAFNSEAEGYNFLKACLEQKAGGNVFDSLVFKKGQSIGNTMEVNITEKNTDSSSEQENSKDKDELKPTSENNLFQNSANQALEDDETILYYRAKNLQKHILTQKKQEHRMIGVWAPLNKAGVTNFVINFSIFLASYNLNVSVLEGLSVQAKLKEWLLRYSNMPKNWVSYASAIYGNDSETKEINWEFKNVKFYPLDNEDFEREWNQTELEIYMETQKVVDITLVDLPTGKMTPMIEMSLQYLDELWILGDSTIPEIFTWKEYIKNKKIEIGIPFYFIFNSSYHPEHGNIIAKELDLPLLVHLPPLHKQIMENYFEKQPIIEKREALEKLEPPFLQLVKHIFGEDFQKEPVQVHEKRNILRNNWTNLWKKWLLKK